MPVTSREIFAEYKRWARYTVAGERPETSTYGPAQGLVFRPDTVQVTLARADEAAPWTIVDVTIHGLTQSEKGRGFRIWTGIDEPQRMLPWVRELVQKALDEAEQEREGKTET